MNRVKTLIALGRLCLIAWSCDFVEPMTATKTLPQKIKQPNDPVT